MNVVQVGRVFLCGFLQTISCKVASGVNQALHGAALPPLPHSGGAVLPSVPAVSYRNTMPN